MLGRCFTKAFALVLLAVVAGRSQAGEQEWGTLQGQAIWGGKDLPKPEVLNVNKDQSECLKNGDILSENYVVNKTNKGVRWVFVWLAPLNPKEKLPIHPDLQAVPKKIVEMDQPFCRFEPHAVALREGQTLVVKNSATIVHNTNWNGGDDNPGANRIIPAGGKIEIKDLTASRIPVTMACNIHGWMKAYIRVFNHPYFAITDADGKFEMKKVPAGDYLLYMWQDEGWVNQGGKKGQPITIKPKVITEVKAEVKPD